MTAISSFAVSYSPFHTGTPFTSEAQGVPAGEWSARSPNDFWAFSVRGRGGAGAGLAPRGGAPRRAGEACRDRRPCSEGRTARRTAVFANSTHGVAANGAALVVTPGSALSLRTPCLGTRLLGTSLFCVLTDCPGPESGQLAP